MWRGSLCVLWLGFLIFQGALSLGSCSKIAFTWAGSEYPNFHLYLMNPDGSGVVRLTNSSANETYPSWNPAGTKIAFQRSFLGSGIYVIDLSNGEESRLSPIPGFDATPSWSPDGSKIIFSRLLQTPLPGEVPPTQIMVMDANGANVELVLPSDNTFNVEPRWGGPDGNTIVFMSGRGASQQIWTMKADGTNLAMITSTGSNGDPAWSPDGSRISFGSNREGGGKLNIFTMNPDGSNVFQVTHFDVPFEAGDTSWSPDGTQIVFEWDIDGQGQSNPNVPAAVWIVKADGSGSPSTTGQNCSSVGCSPRWQPVPRHDGTSSASSFSLFCYETYISFFLFVFFFVLH